MAKEITSLPSEFETDEVKRDKKYGLQYAKYIESNINSSNFSAKIDEWRENRQFAEGTQSTDRLKKLLLNGDKAYSKLDFTPLPIVTKFCNAIKENIAIDLFKPKVNAIDPTSQKEREDELRKIQVNRYNKDTREQFSQVLGVKIEPNGFVPSSDDEEELYMSTEYRQKQELAMEQALYVVLKANRYNAIRDQLLDDLMQTGRCVIKTDYDNVYGIKIQRVDSFNYKNSIDTSGLKDSRGSIYHAHTQTVTYQELAANYGHDKAELVSHAKATNNNISSYSWDDISGMTTDVLYFEFKTTMNPVYKKKYGRNKTRFTIKQKDSDFQTDAKNVEVIKGSYQTWMEGAVISGSDMMLYYRERAWQTTTAFKEKLPSYHVYETQQMPIVRRMIPIAEKAHLALIKLDQMIAEAKPKGLAINESALADIVAKEGGEPIGFMELIDMYNSKGSMVYRQDQYAGSGLPITELENGLPRDVMTFMNVYNARIQDLYFMSGLNPMAVGAAPESRVSTESNKMALNSSVAAISFIKKALVEEDMGVEYRLYEDIILRVGNIDRFDERLFKQFVQTLGYNNMRELMELDSFKEYTFAFEIQSTPSVKEEEELAADISYAIQTNQITLADKIELNNIKSPKLSLMMLKSMIKRNAEEAHKRELENIQAQQQAGLAETQAKLQQEAQLAQSKSQAKMQEIMAAHQAKMEEIALQGEIDKAIAGFKEQNKVGIAQQQASQKEYLQDKMENRKDFRQKDQQEHQDRSKILSQYDKKS